MKLKTKKNKRNKRNKTKKLKGGFFKKKVENFNYKLKDDECVENEAECLMICDKNDYDYKCEDLCRKSLKKCKSKGNSFCSIL
jgi:hypothetical protein